MKNLNFKKLHFRKSASFAFGEALFKAFPYHNPRPLGMENGIWWEQLERPNFSIEVGMSSDGKYYARDQVFNTFDEMVNYVKSVEGLDGQSLGSNLSLRKQAALIEDSQDDFIGESQESLDNRSEYGEFGTPINPQSIYKIYELEYKLSQTQDPRYKKFYAHELNNELDVVLNQLISIMWGWLGATGHEDLDTPELIAAHSIVTNLEGTNLNNLDLSAKTVLFQRLITMVHHDGKLLDYFIGRVPSQYTRDFPNSMNNNLPELFLNNLSNGEFIPEWNMDVRREQDANRLSLRKQAGDWNPQYAEDMPGANTGMQHPVRPYDNFGHNSILEREPEESRGGGERVAVPGAGDDDPWGESNYLRPLRRHPLNDPRSIYPQFNTGFDTEEVQRQFGGLNLRRQKTAELEDVYDNRAIRVYATDGSLTEVYSPEGEVLASIKLDLHKEAAMAVPIRESLDYPHSFNKKKKKKRKVKMDPMMDSNTLSLRKSAEITGYIDPGMVPLVTAFKQLGGVVHGTSDGDIMEPPSIIIGGNDLDKLSQAASGTGWTIDHVGNSEPERNFITGNVTPGPMLVTLKKVDNTTASLSLRKTAGICAWCKSEYGADGQPTRKLTDEEYATTESHGMCKNCEAEQRADLEKYKQNKLAFRKTADSAPFYIVVELETDMRNYYKKMRNIGGDIFNWETEATLENEMGWQDMPTDDYMSESMGLVPFDDVYQALQSTVGGVGYLIPLKQIDHAQIRYEVINADQAKQLTTNLTQLFTSMNVPNTIRIIHAAGNHAGQEDVTDMVMTDSFPTLPPGMPPGIATRAMNWIKKVALNFRKSLNFRKANILDPPNSELDPGIWTKGDQELPLLRPEVKRIIVSRFFDYLRDFGGYKEPEIWVKNMFYTGSTATYLYRPTSDIDVHVIVDWDLLGKANPTKMYPDWNKMWEELTHVFWWTLNAEKLIGTKHPLTYYVARPGEEAKMLESSEEIYDIGRDVWLVSPKHVEVTEDVMQPAVEEASKIMHELDQYVSDAKKGLIDYDLLLGMLTNENAAEVYQNLEKKRDEVDKNLTEMKRIYRELKQNRNDAFNDGDPLVPGASHNYTMGNIIYKVVERYKYTDLLRKIKRIIDGHPMEHSDVPEVQKALNVAPEEVITQPIEQPVEVPKVAEVQEEVIVKTAEEEIPEESPVVEAVKEPEPEKVELKINFESLASLPGKRLVLSAKGEEALAEMDAKQFTGNSNDVETVLLHLLQLIKEKAPNTAQLQVIVDTAIGSQGKELINKILDTWKWAEEDHPKEVKVEETPAEPENTKKASEGDSQQVPRPLETVEPPVVQAPVVPTAVQAAMAPRIAPTPTKKGKWRFKIQRNASDLIEDVIAEKIEE